MEGEYDVDDLGGLLAVATANAHNIEARRGERPSAEPVCFRRLPAALP